MSNIYEIKLLKLFFFSPMKGFGVRELARLTKLDTKTIMKYLNDFIKRNIIRKFKKKGTFPKYEANRSSLQYRYTKSSYLVKKIIESGLIEFLDEKLKPKAIVLFGSMRKGTYHKMSDIDLFIQADYKRIDLRKFEDKLDYDIQLLFEKDLKQLSQGLLINIIDGITLKGKLEVTR